MELINFIFAYYKKPFLLPDRSKDPMGSYQLITKYRIKNIFIVALTQ